MMKFELDEKQIEKFNQWNKAHRKKCDADAGAIGGRLTFTFTPTGMGTITEIKCICGESINLTDFESW